MNQQIRFCSACGLTDWDVSEISFEAWVRDLAAVVDAAALEAPGAAEALR